MSAVGAPVRSPVAAAVRSPIGQGEPSTIAFALDLLTSFSGLGQLDTFTRGSSDGATVLDAYGYPVDIASDEGRFVGVRHVRNLGLGFGPKCSEQFDDSSGENAYGWSTLGSGSCTNNVFTAASSGGGIEATGDLQINAGERYYISLTIEDFSNTINAGVQIGITDGGAERVAAQLSPNNPGRYRFGGIVNVLTATATPKVFIKQNGSGAISVKLVNFQIERIPKNGMQLASEYVPYGLGQQLHTDPEFDVDAGPGGSTADWFLLGGTGTISGGILSIPTSNTITGANNPDIGRLYRLEYQISNNTLSTFNFGGNAMPNSVGKHDVVVRASTSGPISMFAGGPTNVHYMRLTLLSQEANIDGVRSFTTTNPYALITDENFVTSIQVSPHAFRELSGDPDFVGTTDNGDPWTSSLLTFNDGPNTYQNAGAATGSLTLDTITLLEDHEYLVEVTIDQILGSNPKLVVGGNGGYAAPSEPGTHYVYVRPTTDQKLFIQFQGGQVAGNIVVSHVAVYGPGSTLPLTMTKGLLPEQETTNLHQWSEDVQTANGYTLTGTPAITLAQSNEASAWPELRPSVWLTSVRGSTDANGYVEKQTSVASNVDHTLSVFVAKETTTSIRLEANLTGGTGKNASIDVDFFGEFPSVVANSNIVANSDFVEYVGFNIYRIGFTVNDTGTNTAINARLYPDIDGTAARVYATGFQLEQLSYATTYVPTLGAASATRGAENPKWHAPITFGDLTLYCEVYNTRAVAQYYPLLNIHNGSVNFRTEIATSTINTARGITASGGVVQADIPGNGGELFDTPGFNKIGYRSAANDFSVFLNGAEIGTPDTSGSTPAGLTTIEIGNRSPSPVTQRANRPIRFVRIYGEGHVDAKMGAFTS